MTTATAVLSRRWTCSGCAMAVGRIDGQPVTLPENWERGPDGTFCLTCARRAARRARRRPAAPADARASSAAPPDDEVSRTAGRSAEARAKARAPA